ncbi:MAG: hypothetical protein AABY18_04360 [Candidatus Thermoplasmatota archaeon]
MDPFGLALGLLCIAAGVPLAVHGWRVRHERAFPVASGPASLEAVQSGLPARSYAPRGMFVWGFLFVGIGLLLAVGAFLL